MSGRNNRNDDGSKRLGDILYRNAVIECKVRSKVSTVARARETRELAEEHGLPFVHFEKEKGDNKTIALVTTPDLLEIAVKAIRAHLEWGTTTQAPAAAPMKKAREQG